MLPAGHRPATSWVLYTTSCNTQFSAPKDGQNNSPKHVELTGIINKPLLLHLVGCLHYLYQWCTVKQISDNEIYLLIKYIKSVLWRVAKHLSYMEATRCLKVKSVINKNKWFGWQPRVVQNEVFRFQAFLNLDTKNIIFSKGHKPAKHGNIYNKCAGNKS
jgi:hypothetical protein